MTDKQPVHLMLDIETFSTKTNSFIIQIVAVLFTKDQTLDAHTFKRNIGLWDSQPKADIDGETVKWWQEQSDSVKEKVLLAEPKSLLSKALEDLTKFTKEHKPATIWANSPSFDCAILRHAFEHAGMETPWAYWQEMDVRMAKYVLSRRGIEVPKKPTDAHDAEVDAKHQIELVQMFHKVIDETNGKTDGTANSNSRTV